MKKQTITNRPQSMMDGFFTTLTSTQKELFINNFLVRHSINLYLPTN